MSRKEAPKFVHTRRHVMGGRLLWGGSNTDTSQQIAEFRAWCAKRDAEKAAKEGRQKNETVG